MSLSEHTLKKVKLAKFSLSSKADTLKQLEGKLQHASILPQVCFTCYDWHQDEQSILSTVHEAFQKKAMVIVRSSALSEDTEHTSNAGVYTTVVAINDEVQLKDAITTVISSYHHPHDKDQIFIQPYLKDVAAAGVILTKDPNTAGAYYVVNIDESGKTDGVTSGYGTHIQTYLICRSKPYSTNKSLAKLMSLAEELENLFCCDDLDIEFAFDKTGQLYLFQVRKQILQKESRINEEQHQILLSQIAERIEQTIQPHPYLHGSKTAFGVMPDWNPAEIIGLRPRPLALSLYRELVTDSIWAYQRNNYGYKNLRSFPLMLNFGGLPYIDVRVSLNSFIPKNIESPLADKLANYYLKRLTEMPTLHDKVEFEIVFSCYSFDLEERLQSLPKQEFGKDDVELLTDSLRSLTNHIIRPDGLWKIDRDKVISLVERQQKIMQANMQPVDRIYWLLEDCKRYGTLPFAGLARAAFIAMQMIRSLIQVGIFSQSEADQFLNGVNTVSSEITHDYAEMDKTVFLAKYGHLRPGTYDILSPRYDEAPDLYFHWDTPSTKPQKATDFSLSLGQMKQINQLLEKHKLEYDVVGLFEFIATAIEWREKSKFIFTKSLSDALQIFGQFGQTLGFSLEDLSYANIQVIYDLYGSSFDAGKMLARSIETGKKQYEHTLSLALPPLITSPEDVWGFELPISEPNFITQKIISARVAHHHEKDHLKDAIVLIESADPGFDWLFSHSIAGLVTAYGGSNSHMAIRAGEMGLPAAIGVGEAQFRKYAKSSTLKLDCANKHIEVLKWHA